MFGLDYFMKKPDRLMGYEEMPETELPGGGLYDTVSAIAPFVGPVGTAVGVVSQIAKMVGAHQAQKEAEESPLY